jgi:hypothetical protein
MALHKPIHKTFKYWITWLPLSILFLLALPMGWWVSGRRDEEGKATWIKRFEDHVDDPIDYCKEWLHCKRIPFTNYQINISFLMESRETSWDIIRRDDVEWHNCDSEDHNAPNN